MILTAVFSVSSKETGLELGHENNLSVHVHAVYTKNDRVP